MRFLDLTLPSLAENLALDEALLDTAEADGANQETLRLWESPEVAVVLGRASRRADEANLAACELDGVPVVRRTSGGCAVVIGPGCLMYSAVLSYELRAALRMLDQAHRFVMQRLQSALASQLDHVAYQGTCDLTWQGRKFSGNSLRCKRSHLLYHGTILYGFPLELAERYLRRPPREPDYRQGRSHEAFITNVPVDPARLRDSLHAAFAAHEPLEPWPRDLTQQLVEKRYRQPSWHAER